ncbi:class I SAM-dependent methyltransferase [Streptomyces sp. E11-3]|uniref:class I SAM-dependent methyltransferase n=1 Tax=Streptomyces sp. E11-3 TaxID=3110112 RepID=UPI00397FD748
MSATRRYKDAWEAFWSEASDEQGSVFWDAEPALTAGLHLALFEPHMAAIGLPLIDLGCGNGTQTRFLADRFRHVVGADLSAEALEHARQADPAGQAEYRQLDATDKGEIEQLHAELGDSNVYMRGVLHQCEPEGRQPLADDIATLVGERGRACVVEPCQAAGPLLMGLAQSPDGPPPKMEPVLRHGIAPLEVSDAEILEIFRSAGLEILASGELPLTTTDYAPDGSRIELPSRWLVVGRPG